jgi:hypothetical protein
MPTNGTVQRWRRTLEAHGITDGMARQLSLRLGVRTDPWLRAPQRRSEAEVSLVSLLDGWDRIDLEGVDISDPYRVQLELVFTLWAEYAARTGGITVDRHRRCQVPFTDALEPLHEEPEPAALEFHHHPAG